MAMKGMNRKTGVSDTVELSTNYKVLESKFDMCLNSPRSRNSKMMYWIWNRRVYLSGEEFGETYFVNDNRGWEKYKDDDFVLNDKFFPLHI